MRNAFTVGMSFFLFACFLNPSVVVGQSATSSGSLATQKKFNDEYKDWMKGKNADIPPALKADCEVYERNFSNQGDDDGDEKLDPSIIYRNYPDNLMKPLALAQASKFNIPKEIRTAAGAKPLKIYFLRQLVLGDQTLLIADYSIYLGGPDSQPIKLKDFNWSDNPWSDALDIYLKKGTVCERISHWEGGKAQAHLFRMDINSPLFIYIHEHQEKWEGNYSEVFQRKESLYRLKENGELEKMMSCGDEGREGQSIFVYDFEKDGKMVVASEYGTIGDPGVLKSLHEAYPDQPSAGYNDIVLYDWNGKKFIEKCRYYLASGE